MDSHGLVRPLSERFVGVVLDYWQIFEGPGSTKPGPFLRRYGFEGIDTAGQAIISPRGDLLAAHRSWKTGKGFTAGELEDLARRHADAGAPLRGRLRLSWFLIDPEEYQRDLGDNRAVLARYCSDVGALTSARKVRRPLARVDGPAAALLDANETFLERHVRQFWWLRGRADAPARLVVLDSDRFPAECKADELTGDVPAGKVPEVLVSIDLDTAAGAAGIDLDRLSPLLDEAWRRAMERRPSNARNLTFAKDSIPEFEAVNARVRALAASRRLLAPGGRELLRARSGESE